MFTFFIASWFCLSKLKMAITYRKDTFNSLHSLYKIRQLGIALNLLKYSLWVKKSLIESRVSKKRCLLCAVFRIEMNSW